MTHTLQRKKRLSTGTADASNIYEASVVCVRERSGRIWELIKKKKKKIRPIPGQTVQRGI